MLDSLLNLIINFYNESALKFKEEHMYKVKTIKEETPLKEKKKLEEMLHGLLKVLPELKKYGMDGEVQTKVRTLRSGRQQKHYTLELSRDISIFDGLEPKTKTTKYHFPKRGKELGVEPYFEVEEVIEQKPTSKEIKVSAALTKEEITEDGKKKRVPVNKTKVLADLKKQIITQVQDLRKKQKVQYEQYTFNYPLTVPRLGEYVNVEPRTITKLLDKKYRHNIVRAKHPGDEFPIDKNTRYFGIELEFATKEDREAVSNTLHENNLSKYIHIHNDGSIGRGTDLLKTHPHAHEISILVKEPQMEEIVTRLCDVLNTKLNTRVDKTCGLHVHVDMRTRDVAKSFANLITMQHFLFAMVPANRKTGTYSVPVQDKVFAPQNIEGRDAHYDGVSQQAYTKHKTIEARMHCGTTQAKKIIHWANLLKLIADAPAIVGSPTSLKSVQEFLGLNDGLLEYCESRIAKFAAQHKKASQPKWMTAIDAVMSKPDDISVGEDSEVA